MSSHHLALLFCAALLSLFTCLSPLVPIARAAAPAAELYEIFREPPTEARPFVRWWWNGGRIQAAELDRQLDLLHAAGIGGVEINTIAMPVVSVETQLERHPEVPWLSDEWCQLVRHAAEGARRRGMTADLLVGSGWPLGGRFLRVEQQTQRVRVVTRTLHGPVTLRLQQHELLQPVASEHASRDEVAPARAELVFLRLLRADAQQGDFAPGTELSASARDGVFNIDVPAGEHELRAGVREWGFTQVKLGAPGADGPVVDHFSAAAVRAYLDHMTAGLAPALGGRLGNHLRALFVDSIELDYANWTQDLPEEFEQRRGYSLAPYLPFVLEPESAPPASGFAHTVQKARHDFNLTLVELFHERFIGTFTAFCREQGVLSRLQAYGRETHPLHGSMLVDLPEGESWLWHDRSRTDGVQQIDSTGANQYVSSAAHLTGKGLVSFEAMTSAVAPFQETLADFKLLADRSFLDGVNHPILHGFNYSPRDAGLPGWVRFGSFISEQNPWWPALRHFTDYAGRMSSVLRHTRHQAEVAILPPQADEWGRFGRLYQPFPEVRHPWYLYDLPRAVHHAGNGADFVSERVIREATVRDGRLCYGPQQYSTIALAEVDSIAPATLQALVVFAKAGGKVVILGEPPSHRSGRAASVSDETDETVRQLAAQLLAVGAPSVRQVAPPAYVDTSSDPLPPSHREIGRGAPLLEQSFAAMIPWTRQLLDVAGVAPSVALEPASPHLSQVHHTTDRADFYFLANRSRDHTVHTTLTITTADGWLWRWDPETGNRTPVAGDARTGLPVSLAPHESLLLVFDRTAAPSPDDVPVQLHTGTSPARTLQRLVGPWDVELQPADGSTAQPLELDQLQDLSAVPSAADFGGVARYQIAFDVSDPAAVESIDLGVVHGLSEVTINGSPLGLRWYGPHRYRVRGTLAEGRNELVVTVRTQLANLVRAKRHDPAAQRWASWYPPTPTGLVGPVELQAAP